MPDKETPSFEGLYKAHYLKVQRLCRMLLRDTAEAEETGQEVFLKMFKQYQTASWPNDWSAWLTRVTVNACPTGANPLGGNGGVPLMAKCNSPNIRVLHAHQSRRPWGGSSKFIFGVLFGNSQDGSKRCLF